MSGQVTRVNGPLVEVEGLARTAMSELVELGPDRLLGEVVSIEPGQVRAQAYEYTGGLRPGQSARAVGHPLSARLGPGLLGGVYDGLMRPLAEADVWLRPGAGGRAAGATRRTWQWRPSVTDGSHVQGGTELGTLAQPEEVDHRVLAPPGTSGQVSDLRPPGQVGESDVVAVIGGVRVPLTSWWPVRRPRPVLERLEPSEPLMTGQRVLDLLHPVARGGTAAVPGGFGTGKTVLLQQVAKWSDADVIVYVGCGERGNEMADVLGELAALPDPRTQGRLLNRTVVLANTSNMPMMAREASIYAGVTVAEYFRDMGRDVVLVADSTSRWAEAVRELASRTGSLPAEEGYPASLSSQLAAFYERAGRVRALAGEEGSVTIIGAVSPQGGDMTEPVTSHTQRFVRALWSLDRDLAYARHYPAVSWTGSFSRDAEAVGAWYARTGDPGWGQHRARLEALLAEADRLTALAELMGVGALPGHERVVLLGGRLVREGVLQQDASSSADESCGPLRGRALVAAVLAVVDACEEVVAAGVPAASVEELDLTPVVRAREAPGGEGDEALAAVAAARDTVLARVEALR